MEGKRTDRKKLRAGYAMMKMRHTTTCGSVAPPSTRTEIGPWGVHRRTYPFPNACADAHLDHPQAFAVIQQQHYNNNSSSPLGAWGEEEEEEEQQQPPNISLVDQHFSQSFTELKQHHN